MPIDPFGLLLLSPILGGLFLWGLTLLLDRRRLTLARSEERLVLTASIRARVSDYLSGLYVLLFFSPLAVLGFIYDGPRWDLLGILGVGAAIWVYFWLPSVTPSRTFIFDRALGQVLHGKSPICRLADVTHIGVGTHQRWRPQAYFVQSHSLYIQFRGADGRKRSYTIDRGGGAGEYAPLRDALADFLSVQPAASTVRE